MAGKPSASQSALLLKAHELLAPVIEKTANREPWKPLGRVPDRLLSGPHKGHIVGTRKVSRASVYRDVLIEPEVKCGEANCTGKLRAVAEDLRPAMAGELKVFLFVLKVACDGVRPHDLASQERVVARFK